MAVKVQLKEQFIPLFHRQELEKNLERYLCFVTDLLSDHFFAFFLPNKSTETRLADSRPSISGTNISYLNEMLRSER